MERLTGAEFAARRHLLGLTLDEIAEVLNVIPRTARAWETDRDPIPYRVTDELAALIAEHTALVDDMLASDEVVGIVRDKEIDTRRPRGWYVGAAARATEREPDLMIEWM